MKDTTRRQFLQKTAAVGVAASLGTLGAGALLVALLGIALGTWIS